MASSQGRRITRNRERLACVDCRRRKLRCDRHSPCSACLRRGDGEHCTYQRFADGPHGDREHQALLESRLQHLEQLVQQAALQPISSVSSASSGQPPALATNRERGDRDSDQGSGSTGCCWNTDIKNGATHWSSVWEDIQELRLAMIDETDTGFHPSANGTEHTLVQGMGILFGSATHTSLKEVLVAYLPPRQQLDRYVSAYFKAPSLVASFLHTPHFQRHYQTFWTDPLSSPPLWISILFSICHIAKNALRVGKQDDTRDDTFSVAAGHCLVIGEYFRPKRFALEALLIHTQSQCLSTKSLSPDVAPLCGIMAQTASMMGYHRNPDTLGLTPFEAEMRRRVWSMFVQLDLLISFHLGIPSSIQAPIDAVSPPRNLNNSDFNEDMAEIPPSRPLVESTEIQFCIAKHGFMAVLDKILRHALQSQQDQDSLGQINILDAEIRNTSSALPDALKWRPMTESVFDTPNMIVTRLCVLFIDCKSRCVLHRPYVLQRRPESIRACYDAASMLLRGFCDAYYEFTPEGQAKTDGWFIASLTWHDFLMGAVSLCLSSMIGKQSLVEPVIDVEEVISLLSQGAAICGSQGTGRGPETRRVRKIIDATIHRLRQYEAAHVPGSKNLMVDLGESNQIGRNGGPPLPMPMDDALWDEHLGHYLHLDFSGQDTMPGVDHGIL